MKELLVALLIFGFGCDNKLSVGSNESNSLSADGQGVGLTAMCPQELSYCATLGNGENVCCNSNGDCDSSAKICSSSKSSCGLNTYRCGNTCCPETQACNLGLNNDPAEAVCVSRCKSGKTECAFGGKLLCCEAGTQCQINNGQAGCITPPTASRCKAPQYACSGVGQSPFESVPKTSCCNPGKTCSQFTYQNNNYAGCCPAGQGPNPDKPGECMPLGPKCGDFRCSAGFACCKGTPESDGKDQCVMNPNPNTDPCDTSGGGTPNVPTAAPETAPDETSPFNFPPADTSAPAPTETSNMPVESEVVAPTG